MKQNKKYCRKITRADGQELYLTCPLGNTCEEIIGNKIHRCSWFQNVKGKDPQSEEIIDRWDCAIAWLTIVFVENTQITRGTTQAVESFRNETIKAQNTFLLMMHEAKEKREKELLEAT